MRISEAYNVLGAPETRARYDRDLSRQLGYQSAARSGRRGSFFGRSGSASSSASASASSPTGPAGGRPASGLSRRRTAFRGPPPSFYAAGGWGQQWAKRARNAAGQQHAQDARQAQDAQHAQDNQHAQDTQHSSRFGDGGPVAGSRGAAGVGGFGPGHSNPYGSSPGRLYYWDRDGHLRTQEGFDQPRERTRKMSDAGYYREGGTMANFVAVAGVLIIIFAMPAIVFGVLH